MKLRRHMRLHSTWERSIQPSIAQRVGTVHENAVPAMTGQQVLEEHPHPVVDNTLHLNETPLNHHVSSIEHNAGANIDGFIEQDDTTTISPDNSADMFRYNHDHVSAKVERLVLNHGGEPLFQEASLPNDLLHFYENFGDVDEVIYDSLRELCPPLEDLNQMESNPVSFCLNHVYSRKACEDFYLFLTDTLSNQGDPSCDADTAAHGHFRNPAEFASYVDDAAKWEVINDGWKTAVIYQCSGTNKRGAFRDPMDIMKEEISSNGGVDGLVQPGTKLSASGDRIYSTRTNSRLMHSYKTLVNGIIVVVDIYCDGATLSKSGSQSMTTLRMRISNLRNSWYKWFDIGICPTLTDAAKELPDDSRRKEKNELFQRFLFVVFRQMI